MALRKIIRLGLSLLLVCIMILNFAGCAMKVKAENLMNGVSSSKVNAKEVDNAFISSSADFAIKLFQKSIKENENSLISPLSVMLALAMTANGADTQTKSEMEALLGGEIPLDTLNEYLYAYVKNLPSNNKYKLKLANSIWFRDDESRLKVDKNFLQTNADYYGAAAYKSDFDEQTVKDINNWVKQNTDGMIDEILKEIHETDIMVLINALVFDAQWQTKYYKNDIHDGTFTAANGSKRTVDMMHSTESRYIEEGNATGFIKNYYGGKYSLAALLPNEDVGLDNYIASLTGESFLTLMINAKTESVSAGLPKFSYDYEIQMRDILSTLGMATAFSQNLADFSKLGHSTDGNIFIGDVLHKTFISVDELGTKAGAVTMVEVKNTSAMSEKSVILNRPFVYAILDNATNLPLFIGTVTDIQK